MADVLIAVKLTNEQAEAFRLFMKHYDAIAFMISNSIFDIRAGSATLHFNRNGNIDSIERRLYSYSQKKLDNLHAESTLEK